MAAAYRDLGLVRPGPAEIELSTGEDRARQHALDEQVLLKHPILTDR